MRSLSNLLNFHTRLDKAHPGPVRLPRPQELRNLRLESRLRFKVLETAEMAEFFDPPITEYMYMQAGILSKMNGDSDLLGNVVQDFTQAQKKKFNRLQDFFKNRLFKFQR